MFGLEDGGRHLIIGLWVHGADSLRKRALLSTAAGPIGPCRLLRAILPQGAGLRKKAAGLPAPLRLPVGTRIPSRSDARTEKGFSVEHAVRTG